MVKKKDIYKIKNRCVMCMHACVRGVCVWCVYSGDLNGLLGRSCNRPDDLALFTRLASIHVFWALGLDNPLGLHLILLSLAVVLRPTKSVSPRDSLCCLNHSQRYSLAEFKLMIVQLLCQPVTQQSG